MGLHDDAEKLEHPSFGQIRFNRVSSRGCRFYGSEIEQDSYISLEIHQSQVNRDLSSDWYHEQDPIIRLRISSSQFVEMVTSMNQGSGVPCTIERLNGKKVDDLPTYRNKKELTQDQFKEEIEKRVSESKDLQQEALRLINKPKLSKQDKFDLNHHIALLTDRLSSDVPFYLKCFQEVSDKVVDEAKMEIENAIQHKVTTLGLTELHKQNKLLK